MLIGYFNVIRLIHRALTEEQDIIALTVITIVQGYFAITVKTMETVHDRDAKKSYID